MPRKFLLFLPLLLIGLYPFQEYSQVYTSKVTHRDEVGGGFIVAMSGIGFGGFFRKAIFGFSYFGVNVNFFLMRDDKEFEYIDPITGFPAQANKVNRLFYIPVNLEFKKRLFANSIEDNFRPYFTLQGGIIYGMNFPKEEALENQFEFGYNFLIGFGVDVRSNDNAFFSIRPEFRFINFKNAIAGKKDHSTFEIQIEIGGRLH
jgi:hypothetical protein